MVWYSNMAAVSLFWNTNMLTADWLAQLVERRTTVREVAGSNPDRTKTQGLKITGKIMLAVCSTSASV